MPADLVRPPTAQPGDSIAVVSPSFAAPEFFPEVHEQAMDRSVLQWILTAGRFPTDCSVLDGGVLLLETSEELIPAQEFGWIVRSLGERGVIEAVDAVLVARPPASDHERRPTATERATYRTDQWDIAIEIIDRYNSEAVVCVGPPFGHTRPQWILPYGGNMTVDGIAQKIWADYG